MAFGIFLLISVSLFQAIQADDIILSNTERVRLENYLHDLLEEKITSRDKEIKALNTRLNQAEKEIVDLKTQLNQAENRIQV